mmetsp:Transcript_57611/g.178996  ORF Transcript_57611/g.178996 Transcript_57611/m.178996 type:complete len:227 (+) Transcript_57611:827-1507(+)
MQGMGPPGAHQGEQAREVLRHRHAERDVLLLPGRREGAVLRRRCRVAGVRPRGPGQLRQPLPLASAVQRHELPPRPLPRGRRPGGHRGNGGEPPAALRGRGATRAPRLRGAPGRAAPERAAAACRPPRRWWGLARQRAERRAGRRSGVGRGVRAVPARPPHGAAALGGLAREPRGLARDLRRSAAPGGLTAGLLRLPGRAPLRATPSAWPGAGAAPPPPPPAEWPR